MKYSILLPCIACTLSIEIASAVQTLPFTDSFGYSDGNLFSVASGVWDAGGNSGSEFSVTNGAALTAPSGFYTASGKGVRWSPSGTARRNLVQFSGVSTGELYVSFLLNVVTPPGSTRLFAYFDDSTSSASSPQLGFFLNGSTLGIGKAASTPGVTATLSSTTHLVVARYKFQTGDDQVDLWVDPASADYGAATPPASLGSTTGSGDPASLPYFAISASSGSGPTLDMDELRIGTTWAQVTPTGSGTNPPPAVTNLLITQTLMTGNGLVLRGTGGNPAGTFDVLSTTNLLLAVSNWLSLATHQFDSSGNFDCTNPVSPADGWRFYTVRVGVTNTPPTPPGAPGIVAQPQSLNIVTGQTAVFSVIATGSPAPSYQWFFNTNTPLAGAEGATLVLTNVQVAQAGLYSVLVSNASAAVNSSFAALTVTSSGTPVFDMIGFATLGGGTTGGAGGAVVTVSDAAALESALNQSVPLVVQIDGTLNIGTLDTKPNKTIIGLGTNATIIGNLKLTHTANIIVRNITFRDANDDAVTIQQSERIWVDHCTFIDCGDGELDITHASEWVTVSWCKFYYTNPSNDHRFVNLIGHDDDNIAEDTGHLHISFHHNWWGTLCEQRMPSVRFGRVHVFNNYNNATNNLYCVRSRLYAECLVENNFFEGVRNPWEVYITPAGGTLGKIRATNNNVGFLETSFGVTWSGTTTNADHTVDLMVPGTDAVFTPPYSYGLQNAAAVPSTIVTHAGAGKGPFAP